jgi:ABC-type oligopeptide transport system substrate-binding subunit
VSHVPFKLWRIAVAAMVAATLALSGRYSTSAHGVTRASLPTLSLYYMEGEAHWIHTLDPAFVTDATSIDTLNLTQANLVKLLPDGKIAPGLAHWKVGKDHKTYTFTLRSHLRFSNGDPLTAKDVVWSITRALKKSTGSPVAMLYLGHIVGAADLNSGKSNTLTGIKILNSRQIQIKVDEPIAFFLKTLSYPTADVLDPKVTTGTPNTYLTTTCTADVGAGPFRFVCRNKRSDYSSYYPSGSTPRINLEPNPYFYGKKPHIDVTIPAVPTQDVDYKNFLAGGTNTTSLPAAAMSQWRGKPGYYEYPASAVEYLTPDLTTAPFDNVHCRLALAYAIDRNTINNKILHGAQKTTYAVVPRGMLGYYGGKNNPHYDLPKARKELAQCPGGVKNVQVAYAGVATDVDNEFAAISAMAAKAGMEITLKKLQLNDWYNVLGQPLAKSEVQLADNGWIEDYPDPQDYCSLLLHSGSPYNVGGFDNKQYDRLVDTADVTYNAKKRAQLYEKAQNIVIGSGAWITIGNAVGHALVKPYVHGLVGGEAYAFLVAKNNDWSQVTIGKH